MKFFANRRRRGAITIFLTIILIPTMLFSAVLIDGSRMASAKAMTQEASDLAAASALANYNLELKKQFGLFSIKDPDNMEAVYKESLEATLMAYGFESNAEYSDQIWQMMKSAVTGQKDYSGASFMNLYDFKVESASTEALYPLSEKEVLKTQMVEYAKFRGLYVIMDRLNILNNLGNLKTAAEENEKTASAMEEKMGIDEDNASADRAVQDLKNSISEFKGKLGSLSSKKEEYIAALKAQMQVLRVENTDTEEELDESVTEAAKKYEAKKQELEQAFRDTVTIAGTVRTKAQAAKGAAQSAVSRLKNFSGANSGGNENTAELAKDAENSANDYQKYVEAAEKILDASLLEQLAKEDSSRMKNVLDKIDKAIHMSDEAEEKEKEKEEKENKITETEEQSEAETDENTEENTRYYFFFLDFKTYSEETELVVQGTDSSRNYKPAVESVYKKYSELTGASWLDIRLTNQDSGQSEGKITKDYAKEQSGSAGDSSKDAENAAKRSEISSEDYKNLPSRGEASEGKKANTGFDVEGSNLNASKDIMSGGKHSMLQDIGETMRDDILSLSYMFGTFKTRMTGVPKFTSEAMPESEKQNPYMPEWRYAHPEGELDMRFLPKKDRDTVLRAEIEYLIYGNRTDAANEDAVYATIYAERLANNMIALYGNDTVNEACHAAAAAAATGAALLGVPVPEPVFFWIFLTAWSVAETTQDMNFLVSGGYKIPLIKTSKNVLLDELPTQGVKVTDYEDTSLLVSYEDYLLILLVLKGEEKRIIRSADLIQVNMRKNGQSSFEMEKAFTCLKADTQMSIRYLFGSVMPFGSAYEEQGYTGRMGFSSTIYQGY